VVLGTLSSGQGHMTSFAELLVEGLGWSCPRRISSPGIPTSPSAGARTPPARCRWRLSWWQRRRIRSWRRASASPPGCRGHGGRHRILGAPVQRQGHRPPGRSLPSTTGAQAPLARLGFGLARVW